MPFPIEDDSSSPSTNNKGSRNDDPENNNVAQITVQQQEEQDPFELLLRQELEREVELAWRAYEDLAQMAWDGDTARRIFQAVGPPPRQRARTDATTRGLPQQQQRQQQQQQQQQRRRRRQPPQRPSPPRQKTRGVPEDPIVLD